MTGNKGRKSFYIVVSILLAIFVWFYVNNGKTVTVSVNDLPVEFINEDTTLADRGLMLLDGGEATVDLKLQVPRSIVFRFQTRDIRIVADLSSITTPGKQSLNYSISYPSNISTRDISIDSPTVRTVMVQIAELSHKEVEVRCKVVGNVADGYIAGALELTPAVLELWGQQADIMQVSYAQTTLNITDANASIVKLIDYELYDFNGQVIKNDNIHPASEQIQVTLPVKTVKEVPLVVKFEESAGLRLSNFNYSIEPQTVTISGDATKVGRINEIVLDSLSLEDVGVSRTIDYEIVLPDGVENLSGITTATLGISAKDLETKTVDILHFSYENYSAERTVSIVTSSITVTLRGMSADLSRVNEENVRVVADLSGITDASGNYTVPANIYVDGYDVGAVGSYEVIVHIDTE